MSEVEQFESELVEAIHQFQMETGRKPTHLILGKLEAAKWGGMLSIYQARGWARPSPELKHLGNQFHGCTIFYSSLPSLVIAAEDPVT